MNLSAAKGRPLSPGSEAPSPLLYRFSQFLVLCVIFLLLAGAAVKTTESGLAVPDWPLSFGQLMPPMEGGVFYEHGHRMVATGVGFLTILLAVWLQRSESRVWMKKLGWLALGMVIVQGLLGGMTVLLKLPTAVSAAHACLAQAFFMLIVFIALALSPGWRALPDRSRETSSLPQLAMWTTVAIYIQLVLGAVTRHLNAGLVIPDFPTVFGGWVPPRFTAEVSVHYAHRVWAVVVTALILAASVKAFKSEPRAQWFRRPAVFFIFLVGAQIYLGARIIQTQRHLHVTNTHLVVGALLLATGLIITARSWAIFRKQ